MCLACHHCHWMNCKNHSGGAGRALTTPNASSKSCPNIHPWMEIWCNPVFQNVTLTAEGSFESEMHLEMWNLTSFISPGCKVQLYQHETGLYCLHTLKDLFGTTDFLLNFLTMDETLKYVMPHIRQNSRAGTPQTNGGTNNGGGGRVTTRYLS